MPTAGALLRGSFQADALISGNDWSLSQDGNINANRIASIPTDGASGLMVWIWPVDAPDEITQVPSNLASFMLLAGPDSGDYQAKAAWCNGPDNTLVSDWSDLKTITV